MASSAATPTPSTVAPNRLQGWEWGQPGGGTYYNTMNGRAKEIGEAGVTGVWLPPPNKANSANGVGYTVYDLWDLGEFSQKGTTRTKWGTKDQLVALIKELKKYGTDAYLDAVLNQKGSADYADTFDATEVSSSNRNKDISSKHKIKGWVGYNFDGRKGKYSTMKWNHNHFTATDYDDLSKSTSIFRIAGKEWSTHVSTQNGNYDYLMLNDVDYSNEEVRNDTLAWGAWVIKETGAAGFRLDAVKHYDQQFLNTFLTNTRQKTGKSDLFYIGEYNDQSLSSLQGYLDKSVEDLHLFDFPLHYNFYKAANAGSSYDLRKIFDGTLVKARPDSTVTFVENHDTQPGQASQSTVQSWFKPLAYALILLRDQGHPCVFGGDLYGMQGSPPVAAISQLLDFVRARKHFAYGATTDYWNSANTLGWTRAGDANHDPVAVVISNGNSNGKVKMQVGKSHAGEVWTDALQWYKGSVTIGKDGSATFYSPARSASIWTKKDARGRETFSQA
ncbi:hypothetical protein JCM10213v2_001776 [Rhodosporidiobolus nylandii]